MADMVVGIFDDYGVAEKVIDDLQASGVAGEKISVIGSSPQAASTLHSYVYPPDTVSNIWRSIYIGSIVGALCGFACFSLSGLHQWLFFAIPAVICGAAAGVYIGFLTGIVSKLDITENDLRFHEEEMTQGRIIVGVDTAAADERKLAQKIMSELGAIRLNVQEDEGNLINRFFNIIGISIAVLIPILVITAAIFAAQNINIVGLPSRIILFVCYVGLLLGCIATMFGGMQTPGARKWLNFDASRKVDPNDIHHSAA